MHPIRALRAQTGVTQAQLARAAGTSQPTIAAYEGGSKAPNLDTLERLAAAMGLELVVSYVPPLTREDRRSIALHSAIAARFLAEPRAVLRRARRNLRLMRSRHPDARRLLDRWEPLLTLSPGDLAGLLVDPQPWVRELRQVTPFAGVLTAAERSAVYRRFAHDENRVA